MNGFQYVVIGVDFENGQEMGEPLCTTPPECPLGIPANCPDEAEPDFAEEGFYAVKSANQWEPTALGGQQFPSHEMAKHWLDKTKAGAHFKTFFKYVFIARVLA